MEKVRIEVYRDRPNDRWIFARVSILGVEKISFIQDASFDNPCINDLIKSMHEEDDPQPELLRTYEYLVDEFAQRNKADMMIHTVELFCINHIYNK